MKQSIIRLLALFLIIGSVNAQEFPKNESGQIEFLEVLEVNLPKEKLYANAKEWVAKTFGNYKSAIQLEDDPNYRLIIKGVSPIDYISSTVVAVVTTSEKVSYTISIDCKDNKYRYIFNDILVHRSYDVLGSPVDLAPFNPDKNLDDIQSRIKEINELENKDLSKMKKRQIEDHKGDLKYKIREKYESKTFYKLEYERIQSLIQSLKKSMIVNNDF
jgi:hypothetical protein